MRTILFYLLISANLLAFHSYVKAQTDGLPRGAYEMPYTRYEADGGFMEEGLNLEGCLLIRRQ